MPFSLGEKQAMREPMRVTIDDEAGPDEKRLRLARALERWDAAHPAQNAALAMTYPTAAIMDELVVPEDAGALFTDRVGVGVGSARLGVFHGAEFPDLMDGVVTIERDLDLDARGRLVAANRRRRAAE
jgi:hypothetical protein